MLGQDGDEDDQVVRRAVEAIENIPGPPPWDADDVCLPARHVGRFAEMFDDVWMREAIAAVDSWDDEDIEER
jgi:hypothetical protein